MAAAVATAVATAGAPAVAAAGATAVATAGATAGATAVATAIVKTIAPKSQESRRTMKEGESMTNKQYEHIGRSVECAIRLVEMSVRMDDDRDELAKHLYAIAPDCDAVEFVKKNFGKALAQWHFPQELFLAIGDAIVKMNAKEKMP